MTSHPLFLPDFGCFLPLMPLFLQVVVVQAISALCQKYPRKHSVMMNFLSNMLRDDVS